MTLSHSWLLAEALAWPLTSEESFTASLLTFERHRVGVFAGATRKVAEGLEDRLRPQSRGLSLESIRQLTIRAWFPDGEETARKPSAFLAHVASEHLRHDGSSIRLRTDGDASAIAQRWRWISLALPSDTLIAALSSRERKAPLSNVDLTPQLLASQLNESPVAEGHLHVGAAMSFDLLWSSLASAISSRTFAGDHLQKEGRPPFGSNRALTQRLVECFVVRLLLAAFLEARCTNSNADFRSWFPAGIAGIARATDWPRGPFDAAARLTGIARAFGDPAPSPPLSESRALYRKLIGSPRRRFPRTADSYCSDPLRVLIPRGSPELEFQFRALTYIGCDGDAPGAQDTAFQRLFWQYLRVRSIAFRHLVEQPGTSGLDWFGRHYYRISPLRVGLEDSLYGHAIQVQSRGLRLGAMEMRTSPSGGASSLLRMMRAIARQTAQFGREQQRTPEVGLVLHFIKSATRGSGRKTALHADPRSILYGCRYGSWFHDRMREVYSLERILRYHPEMLMLLRGIDVANAELAIPTWVVLPLLRRVRALSTQAASSIREWPAPWNASPIAVTVHAGEDYRSLLEGIRRVHELVEFGGVGSGDRIGHGVALGELPAGWLARAGGRVQQPKEERLDDLLWLIDRFATGELRDAHGASPTIEREARQLAFEIYDRRISLDLLMGARKLRHEIEFGDRTNYPFMRSRGSVRKRPLTDRDVLDLYLRDAGVFLRGQQPVAIDVREDELALIGEAQCATRRKLAKMQITIESNPSSNLLIGELGELHHHPAFRMQPLGDEHPDQRLLLSINTDNPITFATSLVDEYSYVYYALLQHQGVSARDALSWLHQRQADGWHARFTLKASADPDVLETLAGRRQES